jgi:crotonobetainyl-CoA:carnitine CoA-transferase CaiB-like acyl-CoA transferase
MEGTISKPAPRLGEHTDVVLGELLGLAESQIVALRKGGAIA